MDEDTSKVLTGRGTLGSGDATVPVTITARLPGTEHEPVRCRVELEADMPAGCLGPGRAPVVGMALDGTEIWISRLRAPTATFVNAPRYHVIYEGDAEIFLKGDLGDVDPSAGMIFCSALVPPVPLAQAGDRLFPLGDGTIVHYSPLVFDLLRGEEEGAIALSQIPTDMVIRERRGLRWATAFGEAEILDHYRYEHHRKVGLDDALVQVRHYRVSLKWRASDTISLRSILAELPSVLDDGLQVLSLLSHRRVVIYSASAHTVPDKETSASRGYGADARYIRLIKEDVYSEDDGLVPRERLRGDLFGELVATFGTLPDALRDPVRQALLYLLVSYERGYIEAQLGGLYGAVESLVSGINRSNGQEYLLSNGQLKRLAPLIEKVVREAMPSLRPDDTAERREEVVAGIVEKLPELRRPAYRRRLRDMLETAGIDLAALWSAGADIDVELEGLLKRRNNYIHQGKMFAGDAAEEQAYLDDYGRLQVLIEWWILRLLRCPHDAIHVAPSSWKRFAPLEDQE